MITFSNQQLAVLMRVAVKLPLDKRTAFIEEAAQYMRLHGDYDGDAVDVVELAVDLALRGVTRSAA
jgi:hypothetical protein